MEGEPHYIPTDSENDSETLMANSEDADVVLAEGILDDIANLRTRFSNKEHLELLKLVQQDDPKAKQTLVDQYEPVVARILRTKIQPESLALSQEMIEDLLQEGRVAVLSLAGSFNFAVRSRFFTIAYSRILEAMTRHLEKYLTSVSLPMGTKEALDLAREAAVGMPYDPEKYERLKRHLAYELEWLALITHWIDALSIDDPAERREAEGFQVDHEGWERGYHMRELKQATDRTVLLEALNRLPENERKVISLRFGLVDQELKTLREAGNILQLSPERIRTLELQALMHLRENWYATGKRRKQYDPPILPPQEDM